MNTGVYLSDCVRYTCIVIITKTNCEARRGHGNLVNGIKTICSGNAAITNRNQQNPSSCTWKILIPACVECQEPICGGRCIQNRELVAGAPAESHPRLDPVVRAICWPFCFSVGLVSLGLVGVLSELFLSRAITYPWFSSIVALVAGLALQSHRASTSLNSASAALGAEWLTTAILDLHNRLSLSFSPARVLSTPWAPARSRAIYHRWLRSTPSPVISARWRILAPAKDNTVVEQPWATHTSSQFASCSVSGFTVSLIGRRG